MNPITHEPRTLTLEALNALLRSELSAVETYSQALGKFDDLTVIADLQTIRDEHSRAVCELRDLVVQFAGKPAERDGPWRVFATTVSGNKTPISPSTVLTVLRQGEEHTVLDYGTALANDAIPPECRRLIRAELLPACSKHITELNRLLGGMDRC